MQTDITMKPSTAGSGNRPPVAVVRQSDAGMSVQQPQTRTTGSVNNERAVDSAPATREELDRAVADISQLVQSSQRNLNFSVDEGSGKTVVKVIDSQSDEVIRQIPSEEVVALARRLRETSDEALSGLLMQSRA